MNATLSADSPNNRLIRSMLDNGWVVHMNGSQLQAYLDVVTPVHK